MVTLQQYPQNCFGFLQQSLLTHLSHCLTQIFPAAGVLFNLDGWNSSLNSFLLLYVLILHFLLRKAFTNFVTLLFSFPAQASPVDHTVLAFEHLCISHPY